MRKPKSVGLYLKDEMQRMLEAICATDEHFYSSKNQVVCLAIREYYKKICKKTK